MTETEPQPDEMEIKPGSESEIVPEKSLNPNLKPDLRTYMLGYSPEPCA